MSDVTPNDMPSALSTEDPAETAPESEPAQPTSTKNGSEKKSADKRISELNAEAAKNRHKANEFERRATTAETRLAAIAELFGEKPDKVDDFDPRAEIQALHARLESAETERLRAEVARTENVNPKYITGTTEDEMRAAAQEFRADVEQLIEASRAAEAKTAAAPPASSVTGNGRIGGPQQITSREQLKNMSSKQIQAAMKAGELDQLLGKT
ncbi:MAG: hypothetical protein ACPGXI_10780 [Mycobacterium sp.]